MAVKVMVAHAIANGDVEKTASAAPRRGAAPAKPKRRRSSVYDAEGHEVFITLMCLKCHKMRPLSQFGLRRMADGAIRNQPWCRICRSAAGADRPRSKESPVSVEQAAPALSLEPVPVAAAPTPDAAAPTPAVAAPPVRRPASSVAAEVAAALAAGLRR